MSNSLLDMLDEKMKLYMETEDSELKEVNIPIEYFTEHEVIDTAVRNLIVRYNKQGWRMNREKLENYTLSGFKICKTPDGNKYMALEYDDKNEKEPYRVNIIDGKVDSQAFKIKIQTFLDEIDSVLDKKITQNDKDITEEFENGKITRQEWIKKKQDMLERVPSSSIEYMGKKINEVNKYYEYIKSFKEYKSMFFDDRMTTDIAKDTLVRSNIPSDRKSMERVNDIMPFSERDAFLRRFTSKKAIMIADRDNPDEEIYRGYIIDSVDNDGKFVVLEPIEGERTTFITFENNDNIDMIQESLNNKQEDSQIKNVYEHIVAGVLSKTKSEKAKDDKIVSKYHVSGRNYQRNLEYLLTGRDDLEVSYSIKNERRELVR